MSLESDNRPTSPGEYFGARSLPLDSLPSVWQQRSHDSDHRKDAEKSSIYENESLVEENEVVEEEQNQSIMVIYKYSRFYFMLTIPIVNRQEH